jgi:hypothetical protein
MRVLFTPAGLARGAHVAIYLLEKARVVAQDAGERNYHIFYQVPCFVGGRKIGERARGTEWWISVGGVAVPEHASVSLCAGAVE